MSEHHPYLTLPHLLSLTGLTYPIFSLAFNAKSVLLNSCYAAQAASSASVSLPRYMAMSLNRSYSAAVNDSLNVAQAALDLSITVVEGVIDFFVDTYRSTFLCFLQLVVQGGLAALGAAAAEATQFVESVANNIGSAIQQSFSSAISGIQSAIDTANRVPGINIPTPTLSPPDMTSLQSLTLPTTFENQLAILNNQLPTLGELRQVIDDSIDTPFSKLRHDINATFASLSTNPSLFPIPEPVTITFCDHFDTSMIDNLNHDLRKFATVATMLLILLAVIMAGINGTWQWYLFHRRKKVPEKWNIGAPPEGHVSQDQFFSIHSEISHPILLGISEKLHLGASLERLVCYVFHPSALSCLLIGVCGMIVTELQIWALHAIHSNYSGKIGITVTTISDVIYASLNESITSQSAAYAVSLNSHIDGIQSSVNTGIFGWVNTTTTLLNDTIGNAYLDIQNTITSAFGGTVLAPPIQQFIQCILGSKVDEMETALTFLQSNLVINVPRLNSSALLLSKDAIDEVVQAIAEAAVGGNAINPAGLVGNLVDSYKKSLVTERYMYAAFAAVWVGVLVMGLVFLIWERFRDISGNWKVSGASIIGRPKRTTHQESSNTG
ncbi:Plasma membrane fusion protein PRM1 [Mycena venus]|uniref:Plasma membrane fusion protein PRM1 n=1 Tax=Mycena venus TaxID=2733690 RepID=A0A8H7DHS3_9AGAR|nr:Plasma membrane fusion protein PRM1 [Mycena venus]